MRKILTGMALIGMASSGMTGCADGIGPKAREVNMPAPVAANERKSAVNENSDPVMYLPLGQDVLMPQSEAGAPLPAKIIGPFELRDETLGGALQLILDGTNIPVAYETANAGSTSITVTNLKGPTDVVVKEVCSLANMYCSYQDGILVVKDKEIFTVTIPPIGAATDATAILQNISTAVGSITGEAPVTDPSTRTIVYRATQRTSELARRYFQRLRTNTALVIFETYVWEVSLDSGNSTGIRWSAFDKVGRFKFGLNLAGSASTDVGTPISIGLPTTNPLINFDSSDVFQFISSYGTVKTISQPQVTVLSGSTATLRISDKQNFVSSLSKTTTDGGTTTVSTTTDSVNSGFTLTIGSNWDNATVYSNIDILLQELRSIDTFKDNPDAVVQLPKTTERELKTQVRTRPGDLLLIAGLVREQDSLDKDGLGFKTPFIPTSKTSQSSNTELVFLLKPRVIVFTADGEAPRRGAPRAPENINNIVPEPSIDAMPPVAIDTTVAPNPILAPITVDTHPVAVGVPTAAVTAPIPAPILAPEPVPVAAPAPVASLPVPDPVVPAHAAVAMQPTTSDRPSVEVQPLADAVPLQNDTRQDTQGATTSNKKAVSDPSVIVNYDVLGH